MNEAVVTEEPVEIAEDAEGAVGAEGTTSPSGGSQSRPAGRNVSLSVRTLLTGLVIVVLAVGLGVMTWLYMGERTTVEAQLNAADGRKHAEQIALDYAVQAAAMNFQDINTWKNHLVGGTSPELTDKLTKAAKSMEQLLIPLQWTSTAEPLTAKVRTDTNGVYVVDTFVSVLTKTTQAPDNLQSTATYSITIDSNDNWLITDVGGIGAVVGGK
ncbi:hypothetical protein [Mycobacterium sp. AT1]|uniref:hypothetical protein n=1 Tax=Mycobacterium sp. AT1 TaxID=1961706 RepID=UPI00114E92D3|nr:hypothetical protein [Mycobacterium sp. AT1]